MAEKYLNENATEKYLKENAKNIMLPMVTAVFKELPDDPVITIINN